MAKLITAGCGISQQGFDKWPTWPKYCILTHNCTHMNVGGPASGNEHIARSVCRAIYEDSNNIGAVIVTWTSYNKLDVYVEDYSKELQINNFPSRNFLIDYTGKLVKSPGWWPSSVSDDNLWKQWYKSTLESKTYYYIKTLESILQVQNLCSIKQIPCYMFFGYQLDIDYIKSNDELLYLYNAINWKLFVELTPIDDNYKNSKWFAYNTTGANGLVPVASWHYEFYTNKIIDILTKHFPQRNLDKFYALESEVYSITQKCFDQRIS